MSRRSETVDLLPGIDALSRPTVPDLPRRAILAVLLLLVCLLFLQAWIARGINGPGAIQEHAVNLARLCTLPVLTALAWLVVRSPRCYWRKRFAAHELTPAVVGSAVTIGVAARMMAWAELTARGALGLVPGALAAPARPFSLTFECPAADTLLVAAIVWLVLVPVTEEFIHRGILQGWLQRYGTVRAILFASLIFAAMHEPSSYGWTFLMGILFGVQFRLSHSLWPPIITHASYDGLQLLDELCARLAWNPSPASLPRPGTATAAIALFLCGAILIGWLLWRYPGRRDAWRHRAPAGRPRA